MKAFALLVILGAATVQASDQKAAEEIRAEASQKFEDPASDDSLFNHQTGWSLLKKCRFTPRFMQGLEVVEPPSTDKPMLAISTGWYGFSQTLLLGFKMSTCEFEEISKKDLAAEDFGEGLTYVRDTNQLYQLSWMEKKVFVWDITEENQLSLAETKGMPKNNYLSQGWGLAYFQEQGEMLATDGTHKIKVVDVKNWNHVRTIPIFKEIIQEQKGYLWNSKESKKEELIYINELEVIPGYPRYILANVFFSPNVFLIDLEAGIVAYEWDFNYLKGVQEELATSEKQRLKTKLGKKEVSKIRNQRRESIARKKSETDDLNLANDLSDASQFRKFDHFNWNEAQLNGIAYYPAHDSFLLTGKVWDFIFEVKLNYREVIEEYERKLGEKKDL